MFLNPAELKQLTGKIRGLDQTVELNKMRIPHDVRGDGEVLVSRSFMEKRLGGVIAESAKQRSKPNFDHL